jgi:hypothetical protein
VGVGEGAAENEEWGVDEKGLRRIRLYLASHCERLTVIKRIKKNMMYGRNFATNPATIRNTIMFITNLLFLDFFAITSPFYG